MNKETVKKLNLEKYEKKLILNKPEDINDFDGIPFDIKQGKSKYDLIIAFIFSLDEFTSLLQTVIDKDLLTPNGYIYFAYPKKGNKQYEKYIGRDDFFPTITMNKDGYVNGSAVKFAKMVSFNETFTIIGLKREEKHLNKSSQPSQCVDDYIDHITDVQKHFVNNKEVLALFNSLTPGYQRGWVRYVYAVKTPATTEKHFAEMEDILKEGYKSIDLYRQKKK